MSYSFFPKGVSVINVVVLGIRGGKVVPVHNFRLANSEVDIPARFPLRDGQPVIGPRVYRERTKRELKSLPELAGADYLATLVPLCNTGEPWIDPASLLVPLAEVAAA